MGKAFPYPAYSMVQCFARVSRRSSVSRFRARETAQRLSVAVFRVLCTPLRWSLLFAFSALALVGSRSSQLRTQTRAGHRARRSCLRARPMDVQGLCTMGVMWPRIGLNASPLSEMVLAQKP